MGSMIQLHDFNLYYKKEGNGDPIILLHGNQESLKIFDKTMKRLSKRFTVYALDSRGHGKSDGFTQDFSYDQMGEDLKEFMDLKKIKQAAIYGFSDGGIVAILFALRYPSYVKALLFSGVNIFPKGLKWRYRLSYQIKRNQAQDFKQKKLYDLMLTQPHLTFDDLKKIHVPTLMTVAKHDVIKKSHTKAIHQSIAQSQLILVKNANHENYICNSEMIGRLILQFLSNLSNKNNH